MHIKRRVDILERVCYFLVFIPITKIGLNLHFNLMGIFTKRWIGISSVGLFEDNVLRVDEDHHVVNRKNIHSLYDKENVYLIDFMDYIKPTLLRKDNLSVEFLGHTNQNLFGFMNKSMIDHLGIHLSYLLKHEILIEERQLFFLF